MCTPAVAAENRRSGGTCVCPSKRRHCWPRVGRSRADRMPRHDETVGGTARRPHGPPPYDGCAHTDHRIVVAAQRGTGARACAEQCAAYAHARDPLHARFRRYAPSPLDRDTVFFSRRRRLLSRNSFGMNVRTPARRRPTTFYDNKNTPWGNIHHARRTRGSGVS